MVCSVGDTRALARVPGPATAAEASLRRRGARTHDLWLWPTVYPQTGREGLLPVALVLEAGRKRPRRPGSKPFTAEGGPGACGGSRRAVRR
ncbi:MULTISPECIES: hypothetical protein [unclassified Kitasatospora]|uniref:hypothetical protein n=1 Tax=unclassified Kitasatospora TaxID=2633591 RepID=UPI0038171D6D